MFQPSHLVSRVTAMTALLILSTLLSGCSVDRPPSQSAAAEDEQTASTASPARGAETEGQQPDSDPVDSPVAALAQSAPALRFWGSQASLGAASYETGDGLDDVGRRSSAVVIGRVADFPEPRVVRGDADGDVVTYGRMTVEVLEFIGGPRGVTAGQTLTVEMSVEPAGGAEALDTVAILLLRHKKDGPDGRPMAEFSEEPDVWRLISDQGVFVDRGDGIAVNPILAAAHLAETGSRVPIDDFVDGDDLSSITDPVARDVQGLSIADLLTRLEEVASD